MTGDEKRASVKDPSGCLRVRTMRVWPVYRWCWRVKALLDFHVQWAAERQRTEQFKWQN